MNLPTFTSEELDFSKTAHARHWNCRNALVPQQKKAMREFYDASQLLSIYLINMLRENQTRITFSIHNITVVSNYQDRNETDSDIEVIGQILALADRLNPKNRANLLDVIQRGGFTVLNGVRGGLSTSLLLNQIMIQGYEIDLNEGFPHKQFKEISILADALTLLYCIDLHAIMTHEGGRGSHISRFLPFYPTRHINSVILKRYEKIIYFLLQLRFDGFPMDRIGVTKDEYLRLARKYEK